MRKAFTLVEGLILLAILAIVLAVFLPVLQGCVSEPKTKTIIAKEAMVSGHNGWVSTNHILVADDGTYIYVNIGEFVRFNVGDKYKTKYWRRY